MLISSAAAHAITSPIHLFPVVILDYTFLEQITVITGGGQAVPPPRVSLDQSSDRR